MNKSDLLAKLSAENPHLKSRDVEGAVSTVLQRIASALSTGGRVELRGFGVFAVRALEQHAWDATRAPESRSTWRTAGATRRAEALFARTDKRTWVMQRRERTRQLIELGRLVQKAGLVELTDDDRAVLLGGMIAISDMLSGEGEAQLQELWRRRGRRAFEEKTTANGARSADALNDREADL